MPRFGVRNDARRSGRLSLGKPPEEAQLRLSDPIAVAVLVLVVLWIGLPGAVSSAVAQGQDGPQRPEGGGSEPAARSAIRPVSSPAPGGPAVTHPETLSTLRRDPMPATSDHAVPSTPSLPGRPPADSRRHDGSRSSDTSRTVPPAPRALPGPEGPEAGGPRGAPVGGPHGAPGGPQDGGLRGPSDGGLAGAPAGGPRGAPDGAPARGPRGPEDGGPQGAPVGGPHGVPEGTSLGSVPLGPRSDAPRPAVGGASRQPADRVTTPAVTGPRGPVGNPAAIPEFSAPERALSSPSHEPLSPTAVPAATRLAIPAGAAPRSSDDSQKPSDTQAAYRGGSPPEAAKSLMSPTAAVSSTPAAPSTPVAPTLPVDDEVFHHGSVPAVMRDTVVPATAVQSGRIHTASEIARVIEATASGVGAPLAVGARVGPAAAPPNDIAPRQPSVQSRVSGGPAAGSSNSSGGVPLGLISALLLISLLHWSTVLLLPERWWPTLFLAPPERPG